MNMMPAPRVDMDRFPDMAHLPESNAFLRRVMELGTDCVKILDASGIVLFTNEPAAQDRAPVNDTPWIAAWPAAEQEKIADAVAAAVLGKSARLVAVCPAADGTPKWWDVTVAPLAIDAAEPVLIAIARDITEMEMMRRQLQEKDEQLAEKDLLMHEVHHRAKNSLQLVQGLLGIQSRGAETDPAVTAQLLQSAARVRTIAALHDRLYRSRAALEVEVKPYLTSLVNDMESSLATSLSGRKITFHADNATWTANDVPALGLVLTELMTNAVKYGAGDIRVTFHQPAGEQAVLTVEDQGGTLPEGFDPAASRGLGMKLITSLLRERGGGSLEFTCRPGVTSFVARMPRLGV